MEHSLDLKIEKKKFVNNEQKEVEFYDIYLVFDNYMKIKLDRSDNLKNLTRFLKSGGTLVMNGSTYKLNK